jgi:hypothetical protein
VTFTAPPGIYRFYCRVPAHATAGMRGTLTIRCAWRLRPQVGSERLQGRACLRTLVLGDRGTWQRGAVTGE